MIYSISLCTADEILEVQEFIDKHWKKDHIYVKSKKILDFYHKDSDGYTFIIARNTNSNEIDGILGFQNVSHFDKALLDEGVSSGAIWKVRDDIINDEIKTLGFFIRAKFNSLESVKLIFGSGLSSMSKMYFSASRKMTMGYMHQYYILNEKKNKFNIAKIPSRKPKSFVIDKEVEIHLEDFENIDFSYIKHPYTPTKSVVYLRNRYFLHPHYVYLFASVYKQGQLTAVLIMRKVTVQDSSTLRIIDIYGGLEQLPNIYFQLQKILVSEDAEYVDCLNFGIDSDIFSRIGFDELDFLQNEIVIPDHFEPFERANIKIDCFHSFKDGKFVIYKGDGDQDRPNVL